MNTVYFIIQQTMFFAIPLLIVALGGLFSEKSGVTNIALEGIMIIGAFAGVVTVNTFSGIIPGQILFIIAIIVSGIAGLVYSFFHAWASIRLKAEQTISGTALNLFAPAFCIFISRAVYGTQQINFADSFHINKIPVLGDIPFIGPAFFSNCYISTYIGIALLIVFAVILKKTRFGLRLSACGENPDAAASVGISVVRTRYAGVLLSGILGGMGGIVFVIPTSTNFSSSVAGYGFLALAVLILGQWKAWGVLLAALFFGMLKAVSSSYSGIPALAALNMPSEVYKIIPYVLTIVVLIISSGRSRAPKAGGRPYDDGGSKKKPLKIKIITASVIVALLAAFSALAIGRIGAVTARHDVSPGFGAEIALVFESAGTIDDKSFIQGEWEGIVEYGKARDITRKYYKSKDSSDEAMVKVLDMAVKGKAKAVFCSSRYFEVALCDAQYKYPDTFFVIVDGVPHRSGSTENEIAKNTIGLDFAEEEGGFLAGYAAVMDGYRKLGFMGGIALPAVCRYGYGFVAGADYAASELGLKKGEVSVKYHYANTFVATPEVLSIASSWYRSGTEIIFACGGGLGNSVMKAAETNGKAVIGVDRDQSDESGTIITSSIKDLKKSVGVMLGEFYGGTIQGGQIYHLTVAEGAVGLEMKNSKFRRFTQKQYDEICRKIAEKKIEIPTDSTVSNVKQIKIGAVNIEEIF